MCKASMDTSPFDEVPSKLPEAGFFDPQLLMFATTSYDLQLLMSATTCYNLQLLMYATTYYDLQLLMYATTCYDLQLLMYATTYYDLQLLIYAIAYIKSCNFWPASMMYALWPATYDVCNYLQWPAAFDVWNYLLWPAFFDERKYLLWLATLEGRKYFKRWSLSDVPRQAISMDHHRWCRNRGPMQATVQQRFPDHIWVISTAFH